VVLPDLWLPEMGGPDALTRVREVTEATAVIFSGFQETRMAEVVPERGADGHVGKELHSTDPVARGRGDGASPGQTATLPSDPVGPR
jgi:DNA-binding NarL/FixJ family response regulator